MPDEPNPARELLSDHKEQFVNTPSGTGFHQNQFIHPGYTKHTIDYQSRVSLNLLFLLMCCFCSSCHVGHHFSVISVLIVVIFIIED